MIGECNFQVTLGKRQISEKGRSFTLRHERIKFILPCLRTVVICNITKWT